MSGAAPNHNAHLNRGASSILSIRSLPEILIGEWALKRSVTGQDIDLETFDGKASFSGNPEGLLYREDMKVPTQSGGLIKGHREYAYCFFGESLSIYYSYQGKRGDLFMELEFITNDNTPELLNATGTHLCGQDLYTGEFEFNSNSSLAIRFRVVGPKKNYRIDTEYTKCLT